MSIFGEGTRSVPTLSDLVESLAVLLTSTLVIFTKYQILSCKIMPGFLKYVFGVQNTYRFDIRDVTIVECFSHQERLQKLFNGVTNTVPDPRCIVQT